MAVPVLDSRIQLVDELLFGICEKLQISASTYQDAESKYEAIGRWLSDPSSKLHSYLPAIYPQGSVRLQTTVKPIGSNEHDIDCICQFNALLCSSFDPVTVYEMVEDRLKENEIYKARLSRFKRCLRIEYANDFHLDITPACPDEKQNNGSIFVTDTKMEEWKPSNPLGFAKWFGEQCIQIRKQYLEAHAEPLPPQEEVENKAPLKRSVQLIKRHRDIAFLGEEEQPRSIVLTTLAGFLYNGVGSTLEALIAVVGKVYNLTLQPGIPIIRNPLNKEEIFSESWNEHLDQYEKFQQFIAKFHEGLGELQEARGIHRISEVLKRLFGETVTDTVIKEHAEKVSQQRNQQMLYVGGALSSLTLSQENTMPIKPNTFYGK